MTLGQLCQSVYWTFISGYVISFAVNLYCMIHLFHALEKNNFISYNRSAADLHSVGTCSALRLNFLIENFLEVFLNYKTNVGNYFKKSLHSRRSNIKWQNKNQRFWHQYSVLSSYLKILRTTQRFELVLSELIDWLIGMLLVSRSGLVEDNAVKMFHHYGVHLFSSFLM